MSLRTKPFKQSKMMCGPASLKIVADYFGIQAGENKLAKLCKSNKIMGTTGENLLRGARAIGLHGSIIDDADFKTIQYWLGKDIPVIVDWMSPGQSRPPHTRMAGGHYSVVVGLTPTHIVLEDPGLGLRRRIKRADFMSVWFDFDDLYPERKSDIILRRIIVINRF